MSRPGTNILSGLRRQWTLAVLLRCGMLAAGIAVLLAVFLHGWLHLRYGWAPLYFGVLFPILLLLGRVGKVNETRIAQWLNQQWPETQESSELLLEPETQLSALQLLQYRKTATAIINLRDPLQLRARLWKSAGIMAALVLTAGLLLNYPGWTGIFTPTDPIDVNRTANSKPVIEANASSARIHIQPPAYTGKPERGQSDFNLTAEQSSRVQWTITTKRPAQQLAFVFNDALTVPLTRNPQHPLEWHCERQIDTTGFYQLSVDGRRSPLYKIETIADHAPVVALSSPKPYSIIDIGEPQQVSINGTASDDYALTDVHISATVASGSGEAVKFKEQRINFPGFSGGATARLQLLLHLPGLNMHPGDELYFYVQATDNNHQQVKSDVYIVHLPDTAQLLSLDGITNNLNLKPEYFRSERQIIIETEQLLKDKDTLPESVFKDRCNNLGIDQKLLRLRYGKFLGDENESDESGINDIAAIEDFSNADKIRETFTDKHDNAEDATFYTAETKKQLRATLAEMWNAEIKLRTFSPQQALPFEYKALRLLKDLQQQDRVYVAKTNIKTTPPDPKKRLTGDLAKIQNRALQKDIPVANDPQVILRQALAILQAARAGHLEGSGALRILEQTNLQLHEKAIRQPGMFLPAVESMKRILDAWSAQSKISVQDISLTETAIQQTLHAPLPLPATNGNAAIQSLSDAYFENLQKSMPR